MIIDDDEKELTAIRHTLKATSAETALDAVRRVLRTVGDLKRELTAAKATIEEHLCALRDAASRLAAERIERIERMQRTLETIKAVKGINVPQHSTEWNDGWTTGAGECVRALEAAYEAEWGGVRA